MTESNLPVSDPTVSAVIVSHNSLRWLDACLESLLAQTHQNLEIILVDNASADNSAAWVKEHFPGVQILPLEELHSLSHAINIGVQASSGDFFLLLNPDIVIEPDALEYLLKRIQDQPTCAAVAAKLKFLWAPGFLNGIGNRVGAFSWGTDNALGHLDLGQFDSWQQVPSVCFAAALISRRAWQTIGPLDEGFPLYYEDSEWSYRARLLGYTHLAEPRAVVYHAFSGRVPTGESSDLAASKLRRVTFGRLRFAAKLLSLPYLLRFLATYLLEDLLRVILELLRGKLAAASSSLHAWKDFLHQVRPLSLARAELQSRRRMSDREIFGAQGKMPASLIWNGLPELTWDLVETYYLPSLLEQGAQKPPELVGVSTAGTRVSTRTLSQLSAAWRYNGARLFFHRLWRMMQVWLARP